MAKLQFPKPEGLVENIEAFFTAVDITEKINLLLIGFNISMMLLILFTRKYHRLQLGVFIFLLILCYFLETINRYLGQNWKKIASQNYFDNSGFFMCVMVGFPSLCNCLLVMINSFRNTFSLLVSLAKEKKSKKD